MAQKKSTSNNGAMLGFEQTLWQAADKMRGHMAKLVVTRGEHVG